MNKPHMHSCTAHWHTIRDSYEPITWYKIICYSETIDLWVTQRNKPLSGASFAAIRFNPLSRSLHSNDVINTSSKMLTTQRYSAILQTGTWKSKTDESELDVTRILRWDDNGLFVRFPGDSGGKPHPGISSIIQTSGGKRTWIYYSIIREAFLHSGGHIIATKTSDVHS